MGRRKKQPASLHRESIALSAQALFFNKGIEATTMDDIAKAAGYSKATLYVYFENKEEIIGVLVLESMKKLLSYITKAIKSNTDTKTRYEAICRALVQYHQDYPFYFELALSKINIDFNNEKWLPEEKETFQVGEEINALLISFLKEGIKSQELREDLPILPTLFAFWGMLSGVITLADHKKEYLQKELSLSPEAFLQYSFMMLYQSIERGTGTNEEIK